MAWSNYLIPAAGIFILIVVFALIYLESGDSQDLDSAENLADLDNSLYDNLYANGKPVVTETENPALFYVGRCDYGSGGGLSTSWASDSTSGGYSSISSSSVTLN